MRIWKKKNDTTNFQLIWMKNCRRQHKKNWQNCIQFFKTICLKLLIKISFYRSRQNICFQYKTHFSNSTGFCLWWLLKSDHWIVFFFTLANQKQTQKISQEVRKKHRRKLKYKTRALRALQKCRSKLHVHTFSKQKVTKEEHSPDADVEGYILI